MPKLKAQIFLLLFLFSICVLNSEEVDTTEPIYYYGAYAAYNINHHSSSFKELPGIPSCCAEYKSGTGGGFSFGGLFELPLNKAVGLGLRLGFSSLDGVLKAEEIVGNTQVIKYTPLPDTSVVSAKVEHSIDSRLYTINLQPTINFKFFRNLYMEAGLNLSYLFSAKVDHQELLVDPENAVFLEGRAIRNDVSDVDLPDKSSFLLFGIMGIGYQLPIGKKTYIMPEIRYHIPFINISSVNWKPASFQIGVALKIPVFPEKELPEIEETIYERDTVIVSIMGLEEEKLVLLDDNIEKKEIITEDAKIIQTIITENYELQVPKAAVLTTELKATGISKDGTRQSNPTIVIEELETEEGFPLLPHVYFPEGSAELDKTGLRLLDKNETDAFSEQKLPWNTLDIYSDILNIIASRMKAMPNASLTITGCNNNIGVEKNNKRLSRNRAIAVRKYLRDTWGIEESKLRIKERNLPIKPGNNTVVEGQDENRRAELTPNFFEIIKPIELKEILRTSNPPVVEIEPLIEAEAGLENWNLDINQEEKELRSYNGSGEPDKIVWNVEEKPLPLIEAPVDIQLNATDKTGQEKSANTSLTLKQLTITKKRYELKDDKRIERFSLIVFDYDKAEISPLHKRILKDLKSRIKPNSKVTIAGYADRTGEPEYNRMLADRRTREVQKVLRVKKENLTLVPVGSDVLLYDNDLPQGRGYSRTVQITIETPVK